MTTITNCRIGIVCTMTFLLFLLLVGCAANTDSATHMPTDNVTTQSSSSDIPIPEEAPLQERKQIVESDYDVNSDYILLQDLTIPSFDFLDKFKNLRKLDIVNCSIHEDVALPHFDTLEELFISGLDGRSVFDFVNSCLPLPKLQYLSVLNEDAKDETVLHEIPSVSYLLVETANPIEAIKNNSQVTNLVIATDGYGRGDIQNLDGLKKFRNLKALTVRAQFTDLSALSDCDGLEELVIFYAPSITTLKPLFGLQGLATIEMAYQAYLELPQEERDHFNFGNNDELDAAHIFCR